MTVGGGELKCRGGWPAVPGFAGGGGQTTADWIEVGVGVAAGVGVCVEVEDDEQAASTVTHATATPADPHRRTRPVNPCISGAV